MPWRGTPVAPTETLGFQVADWIEEFCEIPDGEMRGRPYRLTDEMLEFCANYFRVHPGAEPDIWKPSAPFVYRGGQLRRAQKWGKALSLLNVLPTPRGWMTVGDLGVGDFVFGVDGCPMRVLAKSPIFLNHDCYEVTFTDHEKVVVNGAHEWTVEDRNQSYCPRTLETRELHALGVLSWGFSVRWRLRMPAPLQLPDVELPLDPYVLGAWLGNGSRAVGDICTPDPEVIDNIRAAGFGVTTRANPLMHGVLGLAKFLREAGVFGHKHVPDVYLRASEAQRLALVQGMMDTDGHVEERGRCEFTTTNSEIYDGFCELLSSLGLRYGTSRGVATLNGRSMGPKWRVQFSPRDVPVVRTSRKAARLKPDAGERDKWRSRHIAFIEPVPSVPTQCITVDAPDGLFLVGRRMVQTHNSPFAAALVLAHAWGPVIFDGRNAAGEPVGRPHPTPWIQIVAVSEEQCDNTWLCVAEMAPRAVEKLGLQGVKLGKLDIDLPGGTKIEPRSSSGRSRLGGRITYAVFDEPHLMVESNGGVLLATTMKRNLSGMGGRWLETTNAFDPTQGSVAQRTAESPAQDIYVDSRICPRRPDLSDDADSLELLDFVYGDSWWVDRRRILADARDPGTCPTTADAVRYFFNIVEAGVSDAVDATLWDAAARPRDLKARQAIALGFDGSRSRDCTSIVASRIADGRWFHLRTWNPADYPDQKIPREEVDRVMAAAFAAYDVRYLFGDPWRWETYFDVWESRWPKRVVEFPTNADQRMDEAVMRWLSVSGANFTHDGDEILAAHAKNTALAKGARRRPRPEEDQRMTHYHLKAVKKREGVHIDAFVAGLLAEVARGQAIEDGALKRKPEPKAVWA